MRQVRDHRRRGLLAPPNNVRCVQRCTRTLLDIVMTGPMVSSVDGDVFGRVTKLGRAAAEAVARAVAGESWDPFYASRFIDTLVGAADGIPSLATVVAELAALRRSPLLAALETSQLQLTTFSVYETGTGCMNLPTSAAQVGAQGTRAMHPRTLAVFNRLTQVVLNQPPRILAPFFLHTKGELCRLAGENLAALAKVSMSCDEGEGHKPDAMLHCGLCTSCLLRRIALHAGGLVPDVTHYRDTKTRGHGVYELMAFDHHAAALLSCRSFDDLVELDPDARFATSLPIVDPLDEVSAGRAVFAMYQRYAAEIQAYLDAARPTVASRPRQTRKERDRDLFSAVG